MSDDHYGLWPKPGTPGRYRANCSCGRTFEGTAAELDAIGRRHDDSPWRNHIMSIANGGRRIDGDD